MTGIFEIVASLALLSAVAALVLQWMANQRLASREEGMREQLKQQVQLIGQERKQESDNMRASLVTEVEKMTRRNELAIADVRDSQAKALAKLENERKNYLEAIKEEEARLQAAHAAEREEMQYAVAQLSRQIDFLQKELSTHVIQLDQKILEGALVDKFILLLTSEPEQAKTLIKGIRVMADDERFAQMTLGFPSGPAVAELRAIAQTNETDTIFGALLQIADLHIAKSELVEAKAILSEMLERCSASDDIDPRRASGILVRFARICRALSDTKDADRLYRIAGGLVKKIDAGCLPDMLAALQLLAEVYEADEQSDKLEQLYKRIHESHMTVGDPEGSGVANNLCHLAQIYTSQGRHAEAEPAYKKAVAIYAKHDLLSDEEGLKVLTKLSDVYVSLKQYADAALVVADMLEQVALAKKVEVLERTVSKTISTARLLMREGLADEAGELFKHALEVIDLLDDKNSKLALDVLGEMAALYDQVGTDRLLPVCERMLSASETVYGEDDKRNLALIKNVARLYASDGQYLKSEIAYKKAVDLTKRAYDEEAAEIEQIDLLNSLADLCRDQGKYVEALDTFNSVLELSEKHPGNDNENIIQSLSNLGTAYALEKDFDSAEKMFRRELDLVERARGRSHLDTVTPLMHLAGLYLNSRRYKDAEPCYQRVLNIRTTKLGPDHLDVLSSLVHLAELKRIQDDIEPAQDFYERALKLSEKLFGSRDARVADMLDRCAELARQRGQEDRATNLSGRAKRVRELGNSEDAQVPTSN